MACAVCAVCAHMHPATHTHTHTFACPVKVQAHNVCRCVLASAAALSAHLACKPAPVNSAVGRKVVDAFKYTQLALLCGRAVVMHTAGIAPHAAGQYQPRAAWVVHILRLLKQQGMCVLEMTREAATEAVTAAGTERIGISQ